MSDNYSLAVGCIVRKEDEVLLVRHTYGGAAGQLLIPGGHCTVDELPEEAAQREVLEETHVVALKAMLSEDKKLLYSDEEYKKVKENKFTLFI